MNAKSLKTKDLIYAGAFSAVYMITLFVIVTMFCVVPIMYFFAPMAVGIVCATIYMMYVFKVRQFGAIIIIAVLFGIIKTSSGHSYAILGAVPIGLLAEYIAYIGKYKSKKLYALSYIVFNLVMIPPYLQIYIATEKTLEGFLDYYGQEYIVTLADLISRYGLSLLGIQVIVTMLGAFIGTIIFDKLVNKHFNKGGIIKNEVYKV